MNKKILSLISAFALTVTSLTSFTANGVACSSKEFNQKYVEGYTLVEENHILYNELQNWPKELTDNTCTFYIKDIYDEYTGLGVSIADIQYLPANMTITTDGSLSDEEVQTIFSAIGDGIYTHELVGYNIPNRYRIKAKDKEGNDREFTANEIKKIYSIIKENDTFIDNKFFIYNTQHYSYSHIYFYPSFFSGLTSEEIETLENYLNEKNIEADFEIKEIYDNRKTISIVPKTEFSTMDFMELALNIYQDTGIHYYISSPLSANTSGTTINVSKCINGDSNCDNELTLADSVAVLQSLGNPDKYALSMEGVFNAEVDGIEGITVNDASVIRQWGIDKMRSK